MAPRSESRHQGAVWELAKVQRHVACLGLLAFCSASAPDKNWKGPLGKRFHVQCQSKALLRKSNMLYQLELSLLWI